MLLGAALLALAVYTISSGPVDMPAFHARYLISMLIATPALVEPMWSAATRFSLNPTWFERVQHYAARALLLVVWCILLAGTVIAFSEVPATQAANQQRSALITNLLRIGANHIYTEYWTCNNVAFASNEQVICSVIDNTLQDTHNRAPGYAAIVHADRYAAYVCPSNDNLLPAQWNCLPALKQMVARAAPGTYKHYSFDGYEVYQPVKATAVALHQGATPAVTRK
jgi:hypothetical protein